MNSSKILNLTCLTKVRPMNITYRTVSSLHLHRCSEASAAGVRWSLGALGNSFLHASSATSTPQCSGHLCVICPVHRGFSSATDGRSGEAPPISPDASIILFPGQGAQYVGMGRALLEHPSVQDKFRIASEILKFDLQEACLSGPADFLSRTQVQQPAILVCSLSALEKLRTDNPAAVENCIATAGFSVGEITALTFAGALSFEDAVRLIKVRSEAMQEASEQTPGGLATVFTGPDSDLESCIEAAKESCVAAGVRLAECKVANHLGPNCKVVGGSEQALQFIIDRMADFKLKRVKRINVSGAFHTEHMRPAADALQQVLQDMALETPRVPVYANIDAAPYESPEQIRRYLPRQIHSSVQWEQTLRALYGGRTGGQLPHTFECGPGQSLKAIVKMVNAEALSKTFNVEA